MKFFELAACFEPAVPRGLARAPYLRELISMFTTVTGDEWTTRKDPSNLPTDSTLESMCSRDNAFPIKLAKALYARLNTDQFVSTMEELDLPVKEIIANSIAAYDEHVDLEHFAYDVTALLVTILHDKAKLSDRTTQLLRTVKMQSVRAANEKYLLVRSRGCGLYGTPLSVTSGNASQDSFDIVFLDQPGEFTRDDFAVTCKPCAEKYNLAHTEADVAQLRTQPHVASGRNH